MSLCRFLSGVLTSFCVSTRFCANTTGAVLVEPHWSGSSVSTPNMSNTLHSPQRHPPDGQQPSSNQVSRSPTLNYHLNTGHSCCDFSASQVLRWKAGLTSGGHRLGGHTSEYHQQFSSKKLGAATSPILNADQVRCCLCAERFECKVVHLSLAHHSFESRILVCWTEPVTENTGHVWSPSVMLIGCWLKCGFSTELQLHSVTTGWCQSSVLTCCLLIRTGALLMRLPY